MHRATHQSRRNANPRYGRPDPVRCTARRPDGTPCKRWAPTERRSAAATAQALPRSKPQAQRRLQQAAGAIIARMIGFTLEIGVPDDIALKAVIAAADRAGFQRENFRNTEVFSKPFEIV